MNLDHTPIAIRPRAAWESCDLGLAMVQKWAGPLYRGWLVVVVPLWIALFGLASMFERTWWAILLVWWVRPLFDRVILFLLGPAVFGTVPTLRELVRAAPRLLLTSLPLALTLSRLDPSRTYTLPIFQLEGLRGRQSLARARLILREGREVALGLNFACTLMEWCLFASLWALVGMLLPEPWDETWGFWMFGAWDTPGDPVAMLAVGLLWLMAATAVQPLFVAAGFALYLNRRTRLEGWDVEIGFRRLAERLRREAPSTAPAEIAE